MRWSMSPGDRPEVATVTTQHISRVNGGRTRRLSGRLARRLHAALRPPTMGRSLGVGPGRNGSDIGEPLDWCTVPPPDRAFYWRVPPEHAVVDGRILSHRTSSEIRGCSRCTLLRRS